MRCLVVVAVVDVRSCVVLCCLCCFRMCVVLVVSVDVVCCWLLRVVLMALEGLLLFCADAFC